MNNQETTEYSILLIEQLLTTQDNFLVDSHYIPINNKPHKTTPN